jgi:hypothetical protein
MSQNPVRNVRGRSSPQGRAHAQSPGNPNKITVGSANHMMACIHVYMMRLASRSALRVRRYNTATQQGAASQKDALHTPTQDDSSLEQSHVL